MSNYLYSRNWTAVATERDFFRSPEMEKTLKGSGEIGTGEPSRPSNELWRTGNDDDSYDPEATDQERRRNVSIKRAAVDNLAACRPQS